MVGNLRNELRAVQISVGRRCWVPTRAKVLFSHFCRLLGTGIGIAVDISRGGPSVPAGTSLDLDVDVDLDLDLDGGLDLDLGMCRRVSEQ